MRFGTGAKTRAWFEIRPLGAAKVRAPTWRDRTSLTEQAQPGGQREWARRSIHLALFTADCVPVQSVGKVSVLSDSR